MRIYLMVALATLALIACPASAPLGPPVLAAARRTVSVMVVATPRGTSSTTCHLAAARRTVGVVGPHRVVTGPHAPRPMPGITAAMTEMLTLINAERVQAGVGLLCLDSTLNTIALSRSQDMIDRHYFSHHIPGGGMVFDILDRDHVRYESAGENLALNNYIAFYPLAQTVRQTNTDLINSPEHRANVLEPTFTAIGIGLAVGQGTDAVTYASPGGGASVTVAPASDTLIVTEVFVQVASGLGTHISSGAP